MKKILITLLAGMFLAPAFVSAQAATINLTSTQVAQIAACDDFDQCPEVRELLIELLRGIVTELLQDKIAEAKEQTGTADYSDFEDATYQVLSSAKLAGQSIGAVPDISVEIWEQFVKVAPREYIDDFVSYMRVYYDEDDFSAAYVETDANDSEKWGLGINLSDLDTSSVSQRKNLAETLIHEFAHIVTLNIDQLDSERRCGTYFPGEGCTYKNSYINEFVEEFWDDNDFDNSEAIEDEDDPDEKDEIADEYFEDHINDYVTAYASWHPAEDIAESFAYFVLQDKPEGNKEVDQKLQFFYDYSELVTMRTTIRNNFKDLFNF